MDEELPDHSTRRSVPAPSASDDRVLSSVQVQDAAPAICRICRGEGTSAEPLFYPCKCSGSIKYVHQDCLMEWLSHSQKKHCELCKTSFRFTKLYAPDMPQSLPVHIFLEHMAKYMFQNALVWLRALVVVSIWICWVPYCMRAVWSFMFWVSDDGLVGSALLDRAGAASSTVELSSTALGMETCPASPLFAPTSTSAAAADAMLGNPRSMSLFEFLLRFLIAAFGIRPDSILSASDSNPGFASKPQSSLLSDVTLIRNLAGNSIMHRTVVWVFEGQLITVLVILSFILVILVRDYVVQQQPEINMRAAFPVADNPLPAQAQPVAEPEVAVQPHRANRLQAESDDETLDDGEPARARDWANGQAEPGERTDERQDIVAAPTPQPDAVEHGHPAAPEPVVEEDERTELGPANERSSVVEYLRIYRQADGNPEEILQIAEEEGVQDRLNYWMDVTRRSIKERGATETQAAGPAPSDDGRPTSSGSGEDSSHVAFTPSSSERSQEDAAELKTLNGQPKGKQREWLPITPDPDSGILQANVSAIPRPRSMSEGPQHQRDVNPLANNSWSFAGLGEDGGEKGVQLPAIYEPEAIPGRATPPSSVIAEMGSPFSPRDEPPRVTPTDDEEPRNAVPHEHTRDDSHQRRHNDVAIAHVAADTEAIDEVQALEHNPVEEPSTPAAVAPAGLVDRVANFMWGDLEQPHHHDDPLDDDANDDLWVDEPDDIVDPDGEDPDGVAADVGLDPGFDADAIDDMDDFDGVMELIGMRGPIAGLFQNAIFCTVLVSVTIFACIFIPYNFGRISLWVLANPMRLVRILFEVSKFVQDVAAMMGGLISWCALNLVDMMTGIVGGLTATQVVSARKTAWSIWTSAGSRVGEYLFMGFPMSATEMQNFSAISHDALNTVKGEVMSAFAAVDMVFYILSGWSWVSPDGSRLETLADAVNVTSGKAAALYSLLLNPGSWVIDLGEPETLAAIDPQLAHWSSLDRFWAILAGYVSIFFIGAMYLKRGVPFSRRTIFQAWEVGVIDTLHQASGIIKVILIISIEMLVFPLYCGLLLDAALLPLFENATFKSRTLFTYNYPLTSVFVHWFVGTGYMFHFALFVSMCRKIMRPGVLYFIRDPDDPEFHPVRDVLERNLSTQLRKILFSAFVYGALVIVCLGGVVWGLSYTVPDVLPIHYSSNEPVLEFPVDLLFYNFLMPLAVKFFKPSDGLHAMYTWCFRKCARGLRLTYFLFGERRIDEEGTLQLAPESSHQNDYVLKTALLELSKDNEVVPKTWRDTFEGGSAKPSTPLPDSEMRALRHKKNHLVETGQLVRSGRFVRAPASDRVKIPKGKNVFLTVTERGHRKDGRPDDGLYATTQYQLVYIPPNFRTRVFLFILFIWLFAAVTGVGFTIVPLMIGRKMFKELIPAHIRTNDIYAFSIGIYLLGTMTYSVFHARRIGAKMRRWVASTREQIAEGHAAGRVAAVCLHVLKLCYAYSFLLIVFPLVLATLVELYVAIPLHTYMHPPTLATQAAGTASRHSVRVIQSWTLGLLYLKLGARGITTLFPDSRPAIAVRSVLYRGWLRPEVGLLTRAFIIPGLALGAAAIFGPPATTRLLIKQGFFASGLPVANEAAEALRMALVYRRSYPVAALSAVAVRNALRMVKVFRGWSARIRDEAYLIGERLHNFGAGPASGKKTRVAWRAGGPRL